MKDLGSNLKELFTTEIIESINKYIKDKDPPLPTNLLAYLNENNIDLSYLLDLLDNKLRYKTNDPGFSQKAFLEMNLDEREQYTDLLSRLKNIKNNLSKIKGPLLDSNEN